MCAPREQSTPVCLLALLSDFAESSNRPIGLLLIDLCACKLRKSYLHGDMLIHCKQTNTCMQMNPGTNECALTLVLLRKSASIHLSGGEANSGIDVVMMRAHLMRFSRTETTSQAIATRLFVFVFDWHISVSHPSERVLILARIHSQSELSAAWQ